MAGGPGFGTIPDIIMGKDPEKALRDNLLAAGTVLIGAPMLGQIAGAGAAGAEAGASAAGSAVGVPPNPFVADSGGIMGTLKTAGDYMKPIGQAASAAGQVGGLFGKQQQMPTPTPMPIGNSTGSQTLGLLATQGQQQAEQQLMAAEQARRQRRMSLLGGV